jgi:hypothetical protein
MARARPLSRIEADARRRTEHEVTAGMKRLEGP